MISKFLDIRTFIISLAVGLLFVYLWGTDMEEIFVYPNPENMGKIQYKDQADNCYAYQGEEVTCLAEDKLAKIPIQH